MLSSDVFEHIDRPWLAAAEIARILKPGGVAITHTLFSWRSHPCPIDYWRFSQECLELLFGDLECLETGYDLSERRLTSRGSGRRATTRCRSTSSAVARALERLPRRPEGAGPAVPRFKDSDHPLAGYLRMDTQGTVTNPKLRGVQPPPVGRPPRRAAARARRHGRAARGPGEDEPATGRRQLEEIARRSQRLERRIDRVSPRSRSGPPPRTPRPLQDAQVGTCPSTVEALPGRSCVDRTPYGVRLVAEVPPRTNGDKVLHRWGQRCGN